MKTFIHVRSLILVAPIAAMFLAVPSLRAQEQAERQLDIEYDLLVVQEDPLQTRYALQDLAIAVRDPGNEILGATLTTLSDTLRAQLNVPAGQGILVASLRGDGPSAQAGLKRYDVLLTLAGKPLATADDLTKHLKAAGEAPVTLTLLRAGKQIEIQVRPVYRVTLGRVGETNKEYFLGIALGGLDDALRSQLGLPAGQGVIIANVVKNSPAEEAGIKAHDIVLEFGGKSVDTPDKLAAQVQAGQDKSTTSKLLRAGQPLNVAITAAMRNVDHPVKFSAQGLNTLRLYNIADAPTTAKAELLLDQVKLSTEAKSLRKIEELQRQIHSLQQAVDQLNALLKANRSPKQ
jgi:membrane-associated protease RseP (regulator of RpoE activity)